MKAVIQRPVDADAIWACGEMSPRLVDLRKQWEDAPVSIVGDSSVSFTKAYREREGLPISLRFAYAFKQIMDDSKLLIREGELIVGQMNDKIRGVDIFTAECPQSVLNNIAQGSFDRKMSETSSALCDEETTRILKEDAEYWVKYIPVHDSMSSLIHELGPEHMDLMMDRSMVYDGIPLRAEPEMGIWGPTNPPRLGRGRSLYRFEPAKIGLKRVKELVQAELDRMDKEGSFMSPITNRPTPWEKKALLKGMIICCDAVIDWAHRYADLAEEMAKTASSPERKAELERIASNCRWVPENAPRDYWEALQSIRFIHVAVQKEQPMRKETALNRMDQDLYPYYIKDKDEGKITPEFAIELFNCFLLKVREGEAFDPEARAMRHSQGTLLPNVTICGMDEDDNDCTNEMSYIILRSMATMKFSEPTIYIRVHDKMSTDFLKFAIKANMEHQGGCPAFLNDKQGTDRFLEYGIPKELCCDWQTSGCLGYHLNCAQHIGGFMHLNLVKIFEIALHDGYDPRTKKQLGPHTGKFEDMKSMEDLEQAYYKQLDYFADRMNKDYEIRQSNEIVCTLESALNCVMYYDTAISYGMNPSRGGTPYPVLASMWVGERGTTDVADSLAGVKKVVFEDKKCTPAELLKAIDANWEGYEELKQECLHAPKYGNDNDYVDEVFKRITDNGIQIMQKRPDPITGTKPLLFKGAASAHMYFGRVIGALPNGRVSGTPINDGGVSAMAGMDLNGPTALLNSAAKFDSRVYMGNVLNMKMSHENMDTDAKRNLVAAMIRTYIKKGGWHLQINVHSQEELIDARKNPEEHQDLLVRVGGYSANYVDLPYALQDEIIQRTSHTT
ncbi:MAG: hypothetical protein FWC60_08335 [Firmicutes bacterium]|nr:hypothetical protein [Bacillota bacterium]